MPLENSSEAPPRAPPRAMDDIEKLLPRAHAMGFDTVQIIRISGYHPYSEVIVVRDSCMRWDRPSNWSLGSCVADGVELRTGSSASPGRECGCTELRGPALNCEGVSFG